MSTNGTYIPPGLIKYEVVLYHLDNVDWLEDTLDGKNTSHYLLLVVFARKVGENQPLILPDINQNPKTNCSINGKFV